MCIVWNTAIIGGMDLVHEHAAQLIGNVNCPHYIHYTAPEELRRLNPRTQALWFKAQPHILTPEADFFIWTDGKVQILEPDLVKQCLAHLDRGDIAILKHAARNCIYEETAYIEDQIRLGSKYLRARYQHRMQAMKHQVKRYKLHGYPYYNGLGDCCIMAFRNTQSTRDILDDWWYEIKDGLAFDQTAIQFVAWQAGKKIVPIELRPGTFKLVNHTKIC